MLSWCRSEFKKVITEIELKSYIKSVFFLFRARVIFQCNWILLFKLLIETKELCENNPHSSLFTVSFISKRSQSQRPVVTSVITHIHDSTNGINEQKARSVLQYDWKTKDNISCLKATRGNFLPNLNELMTLCSTCQLMGTNTHGLPYQHRTYIYLQLHF